MNKLSFIFCVLLLFSCGSKKNFSRIDSVENSKSTEQLYTELYREARLLEFLDIKYRKMETRDSAGNVRIETNVDFSKKTEENTQDSTKIASSRQEDTEKVVDQKSEEERSGAIKYWTWIIGFVTVSMIVAMVVYLMKK